MWHFGLDPYRENLTELTDSAGLSETFTREEAQEDLDYLFRQLKKYHPAWVDGTEEIPQAVQEQYTLEKDGLAETVTTKELWQAAARIAAASRTAHARVAWYTPQPLYLPDFKGLQNGRLKEVDGISIEQLYQTFLSQFSYELESYAASQFANCLVSQAYLEFLGVDTADGVDFIFDMPDGVKAFHYEFVPLTEAAGAGGETEGETETAVYAGFQLVPEHDAALLTLTACVDDQAYQDTLQAFFEEVRENGIRNVIVDLRQNGGGNSNVANRFISYLDVDQYMVTGGVDIRLGGFLMHTGGVVTENPKVKQPFAGDVYVLTSANTFSSAMLFAEMIGDNGIGLIIGETPGNMPESYGDILTFQTPNAKLAVTVPYKVFKRIDQTQKDLPLVPDVETDSAGALEKAYELIAEKEKR